MANRTRLKQLSKELDIEEIAYRITLACCRKLVSAEMHEEIIKEILEELRDKESV